MNSDRSMFDTYRSYSLTKPNPEAVETLQRSYNTLSNAFWYYPMKIYYYFFPPKITCGEDDYKSIADYLFIKFGMTYHINQKPLTPVSSYGTIEDGIEEILNFIKIGNHEFKKDEKNYGNYTLLK